MSRTLERDRLHDERRLCREPPRGMLEKHREVMAARIGAGEVEVAIAIEVGCRQRARRTAGGPGRQTEVAERPRRSLVEHREVVAARVGGDQIEIAIGVEIGHDHRLRERSRRPGARAGERRGLGLGGGRRLYVLGVDAASNRVTVGERTSLLQPGLLGERVHWLTRSPTEPLEATVRIRSRHPGVRALVQPLDGERVEVEFAEAQAGVAPGQAAVFYDGSRVLGGCWIRQGLERSAKEGR